MSDFPEDYPITINPEPTSLSPVEMNRVEIGLALHQVLQSHGEPSKIVLLKPDPVSESEEGQVFDFMYGSMMPPGFKGQCLVKGDIMKRVTVEDWPDSPSDNFKE